MIYGAGRKRERKRRQWVRQSGKLGCCCCGCCGLLTALRLVGHVATVDAAIAEPIAGYTLVDGLALELVVGTRVHCVSIVVEVVVELLIFISCVQRGGRGSGLCKYCDTYCRGRMPRRSRLHSRSPDRNAICWGYNCRCCSGNGPMSKWPLQRAWNTPNMLNRVSFLSMCTYVCVTLRVCVCACGCLWTLPWTRIKNKSQQNLPASTACVCVCACVHECSLVCASECVYLQALEHVLCKENTATQKKYSYAQHTLSHKHTNHTHSHTKRKKQYTFKIKHK